jgi:hypothetical protein
VELGESLHLRTARLLLKVFAFLVGDDGADDASKDGTVDLIAPPQVGDVLRCDLGGDVIRSRAGQEHGRRGIEGRRIRAGLEGAVVDEFRVCGRASDGFARALVEMVAVLDLRLESSVVMLEAHAKLEEPRRARLQVAVPVWAKRWSRLFGRVGVAVVRWHRRRDEGARRCGRAEWIACRREARSRPPEAAV